MGKLGLYRLGRFAFQYSHSNGPASLEKKMHRGGEGIYGCPVAIAAFFREHGLTCDFLLPIKREPLGGLSFALFRKFRTIGQTYGFSVADVGFVVGRRRSMRSVTNSTIDSHPNEPRP